MLFASVCCAQTISVIDKVTLKSLPNALVSSDKGTVQTDESGKVLVTGLEENAVITVSHIGYADFTGSLADVSATGYRIFLSETTYDLEEVVISANKFEEKQREIPQQTQVISAKDISYMNQPTMAETMTQSGNVLVQKSQLGGGSPIIRGFEANKVLMVVDGVRMNNAIYRGGHLQNIITLDGNSLDKIEVVYGPGSVMYGSDALGGVMHFYTKNPVLADSGSFLVKGNAYIRYGSAMNEKTGHIDLNLAGKKFGSYTGVTYSEFGDLRMGANRNFIQDINNSTVDNGVLFKREYYQDRISGVDTMIKNGNVQKQKASHYSQISVIQKFLYKQNRYLSHGLNFQFSTSTDIPRYDRLTDMSGGKFRSAEWYYGPQQRLFTAYTANIDRETKFFDHARVIVGWQNIVESRHDRGWGKSNRRNRYEQVNMLTANADFTKKSGKNEIRYGIEGVWNNVNSDAHANNINTGVKSSLDTRYPNGGSQMNMYSAYLTDAYQLNDKLIASAGLRYTHTYLKSTFNDTTFFPFPYNSVTQNNDAMTGNIGLVYLPGNDWRFAALASSGFRSANVDDMSKVFESTPGRLIVPNPNLKPEYTYNAEMTVGKVFAKKIKLDVTGFYTWYRNVITTLPYQLNGADSANYAGNRSRVYTSQNANKAYVYGLSANLAADITRSFSVVSTFNYTYGRIKTDSSDYPLDHVPPIFGKVAFIFKVKKVKGDFYAIYNGAKTSGNYNLNGEDNQQYSYDTKKGFMPAWVTFNIRAAYHFNKYLQLQAAVENLLDTNYRVFASGVSAPGRNFVLTLRGSF